MVVPLTDSLACHWLADPWLVTTVLVVGGFCAAIGWLHGCTRGERRFGGLGFRLAMLAWLAAAAAGVTWQAEGTDSRMPVGVLDIQIVAPPVAWMGDTAVLAVAVTSAGLATDALRVVASEAVDAGDGTSAVDSPQAPLVVNELPSSPDAFSGSSPGSGELAARSRFQSRLQFDHPGRHLITVEVTESVAGRADRTFRRSCPIDVIEGPVSLLLVDDRPRFETRFLDHCLGRELRIQHRLHLQSSEQSDHESIGRSIVAMPITREEWNRYDCVVIGAIDPSRTSAECWAALGEAVAIDGLGVIWAMDGRCDLEALGTSPLRRWMPVTGVRRATDAPGRDPLTLQTPVASDVVPWWLRGDSEDDFAQWRGFAPAYDVLRPMRVRPTARTVLTFSENQSPAILEDRFGRGRVIAFLSETWRWRGVLQAEDRNADASGNAARVDELWRKAILAVAAEHLASFRGLTASVGTQSDDILPMPIRAGSLADDQRPIRRIAVLGHPIALALFLVLSSVEWWLRARGGMP